MKTLFLNLLMAFQNPDMPLIPIDEAYLNTACIQGDNGRCKQLCLIWEKTSPMPKPHSRNCDNPKSIRTSLAEDVMADYDPRIMYEL